jgi:hypothetical protein
MQYVVWPWSRVKWADKKRILCDKITSITDFDTKFTSQLRCRPRQISTLFTALEDNEASAEFIQSTLPYIQQLIHTASKTFKGFEEPLLIPGARITITFTRKQAATIIACMLFNLFDYKYIIPGQFSAKEFQTPTLTNIFTSQNIFALKCILCYFSSLVVDMTLDDSIIVLKRNIPSQYDWAHCNKPITNIILQDGLHDNSHVKMHTAYAHEYIGGLMFKESISNEEIILLTRPECLIATLFCAHLYNDTLTVFGAAKMSQYRGYGSNIQFMSKYDDAASYSRTNNGLSIRQIAIVFMDACPRTSGEHQFITDFGRDLTKAYCGFSSLAVNDIATGCWSYGFNGNNLMVKFIQQVLAATATGKNIYYYPNNHEFKDELISFIDWIENESITVSQLYNGYYKQVMQCGKEPNSKLNELNIFECLRDE